jgi:hypothetical protein
LLERFAYTIYSTIHCCISFSLLVVAIYSMNTTVDVVFCVDYTSSMASYFRQIPGMIESLYETLIQNGCNVRMSLVQFRSVYDLWRTNEHGFTGNVATLLQWLASDTPGGVSPDGCEAVGK